MNYFFTLKLAAKVVIISQKNKNWLKRLKIERKAKTAIMTKIAELDKIAIFLTIFLLHEPFRGPWCYNNKKRHFTDFIKKPKPPER